MAKSFFDTNRKVIIQLGAVGLLAFLIKKNWWRIQRLLSPNVDNNSPNGIISNDRKQQLESIASKLYQDIYSTPWLGHDYTPYTSALSLFDNEIIYMAKHYKSHLSNGVSLWEDIESEFYATGDSPLALQVKLKELNQN